jgi:hypothetical protein
LVQRQKLRKIDMANGPGKYDALCTLVRELAQAEGVILIIKDGVYGSGFSVQSSEEQTMVLPSLLEHIAQSMRGAAH